ncbi:hypothetical protein TraAM80_05648, partial [Trypanosoma rangeli]
PNARPPAAKGCARMGAPTGLLLGPLAAKAQSRGPKAGYRGAPQVSRERGGEGLVYTGPRRAAGKEDRHPAEQARNRHVPPARRRCSAAVLGRSGQGAAQGPAAAATNQQRAMGCACWFCALPFCGAPRSPSCEGARSEDARTTLPAPPRC